MAALNGTFDASNVEPAQARDIVPPGKYVAQIIASEMKDTAAGGQMLELTLEIQDGPHARRKLWDNLNLVNSSQKAVEIAQRTLSAICHATGRMQVNDSEELHFRPLLITVGVKLAGTVEKSGYTHKKDKNEVTGYAAANGAPVAVTAPRPMASAPVQQPRPAPAPVQAAPASNQPPWRRTA